MTRAKKVALTLTLVFTLTLVYTANAGEIQHIDKTLVSPFLVIKLDSDVSVPEDNSQLIVYKTDYARVEDSKWKKMFFGTPDADVKDEWAGWDLEKNQVYYPELEHKYSLGDVFTVYDAYMARLQIRYKDMEVLPRWNLMKNGTQAEKLSTTPEEAISIAQRWIECLSETIGWDGLVFSECHTFPIAIFGTMPGTTANSVTADKNDSVQTGFYIVEFFRVLDGIPVAIDAPSIEGDTVSYQLFGDVLQLYIDDDGVFRVDGFYRSYTKSKAEPMTISLDEAIDIVQENMDYISFYPKDTTTLVSQIELCYRVVQTLPTYDKDVNACAEARPAWRFASAIKRDGQNSFVMFVDAISGEVLP